MIDQRLTGIARPDQDRSMRWVELSLAFVTLAVGIALSVLR
jgi:hypothetical protein